MPLSAPSRPDRIMHMNAQLHAHVRYIELSNVGTKQSMKG